METLERNRGLLQEFVVRTANGKMISENPGSWTGVARVVPLQMAQQTYPAPLAPGRQAGKLKKKSSQLRAESIRRWFTKSMARHTVQGEPPTELSLSCLTFHS